MEAIYLEHEQYMYYYYSPVLYVYVLCVSLGSPSFVIYYIPEIKKATFKALPLKFLYFQLRKTELVGIKRNTLCIQRQLRDCLRFTVPYF